MSKSIVKFFESHEVRFIPHPQGSFEFGILADDLATILEASSGTDIARAIEDDWLGLHNVRSSAGTRKATVIWEPGIYEALVKSRKPKAKPFKKWLFEEVLPSIRKTGKYEAKNTYRLPPVVKYMTEADPLKWTLQFTDEYYRQLERLTGLVAQGNKRPARWGQLTNQLVYQYLPEGVADALRDYRDVRGKNEKLHQFFSEKGFDEFKAHMERLLILMQSVGDRDIDHLIRLLDGCVKRQYQLYLF